MHGTCSQYIFSSTTFGASFAPPCFLWEKAWHCEFLNFSELVLWNHAFSGPYVIQETRKAIMFSELAVVWIQDAPTIGKDSPRDVLRWIEERITCRIPEEDIKLQPTQLVHSSVTADLPIDCAQYIPISASCL